jgi:3-methylfumaryl-CoA hydratase
MNSDFSEWIGKAETRSDEITPAPMAGLSATLDRDDPYPRTGDPLPPLWHWLYFLPCERQSELGDEGHAKTGGFMPSSPLPRRMWAGSRVDFRHPLKVGDTVRRESRILKVTEKEGRSGPLLFVVVGHEISNDRGIALTEEHDIVYRDHPRPGELGSVTQIAPTDCSWERTVEPDDALLFRYSALTFNAHRIHYDRRYATETEGYSGLVVHGPLLATFLVDLVRRHCHEAEISAFRFRALMPLFDGNTIGLRGRVGGDRKTIALWASNESGELAVEAEAITAG